MGKSRSLAILVLGLVCILLIACQTAGAPKKASGTPPQAGAAAGPQAPPAKSVSQDRRASASKEVRSVASAKRKHSKGKAVAAKLKNPSRAVKGQSLKTMRTILYSVLAVILVVVIGAIAAERAGRRRKLTPAPMNARH